MKNGPWLWREIITALTTKPERLGMKPSCAVAIVAGGAVRDYMLDLPYKDIDVFVVPSALQMNMDFAGLGFALRPAYNPQLPSNHPEYDEWSGGMLKGIMDGIFVDSEGDKHVVNLIYRMDLDEEQVYDDLLGFYDMPLEARIKRLVDGFDSEINKVVYDGGDNARLYGDAEVDFKCRTYTCSDRSYSPKRTYERFLRFNARNPDVLSYIPNGDEDQPDPTGADFD